MLTHAFLSHRSFWHAAGKPGVCVCVHTHTHSGIHICGCTCVRMRYVQKPEVGIKYLQLIVSHLIYCGKVLCGARTSLRSLVGQQACSGCSLAPPPDPPDYRQPQCQGSKLLSSCHHLPAFFFFCIVFLGEGLSEDSLQPKNGVYTAGQVWPVRLQGGDWSLSFLLFSSILHSHLLEGIKVQQSFVARFGDPMDWRMLVFETVCATPAVYVEVEEMTPAGSSLPAAPAPAPEALLLQSPGTLKWNEVHGEKRSHNNSLLNRH